MRLGLLALAIVLAVPATAKSANEPPAEDLIHSDVPLFTSATKEKWPQQFFDPDAIGGCTSRVAFGVWRYHDADSDEYQSAWHLFRNYGVMHCWAVFSSSDERGDLLNTGTRPGFFVRIGKAADKELWVIQYGARPGSEYLLLARAPDEKIIKRFDVLQRDCPRSMRRDPPNLDIMITKYCAINTRSDLLALARRMAKLPPLGTLSWTADVPEDKKED